MTLRHGVTANTSDRIVLGPGAVYANWENGTGTLLGACVGGGSFTLSRTKYSIRPDGAKGKIKGLQFIENVEATLQMNLLESTKDNLVKFGLAFNEQAYASAEAPTGTANGTLTTFGLANTPDFASAASYIRKVFVDGVEKTYTTDYTIATTVITFVTAPATGAVITADYTYAGTAASGDYYRLTGDTSIAAGDYLENIALVLEYTGNASVPTVLIIKNPTSTGELSLSLPTNEQEVVFPVTWEAHFDDSDLEEEPWEIFQA